MTRQYIVRNIGEAKAAGWPYYGPNCDEDIRNGIWLEVDGGSPQYIATDAGEPEDMVFTRDLAWIAPLLGEVYREGWLSGFATAAKGGRYG